MIRSNKLSVLALLGAVAACGSLAHGAALVLLSFEASTDGGATYHNSVTASAGTDILFRITEQMAGTNTTNGTKTINTLTSADGVNSLKFNITNSDGGTFSNLQLGSVWSGGSGASVGTGTTTVTGVRPIAATGVFFGATAPSVLLTGTYVVGSNATVTGAWASGYSGSYKINNGGAGSGAITFATESGADPIVGYTPLTVSLPSSASVSLVAGGTPTTTIQGNGGSYIPTVVATPGNAAGSTSFQFAGNHTGDVLVALDLSSNYNAANFAAVFGSLNGATDVTSQYLSTFGSGYDVVLDFSNTGSGPFTFNYSLGGGVTVNAIAVVPEPTAALAALPAVALLGRRRRA